LPLALFALSQGPTSGWTSTKVWGTGLAGIAFLLALVVVELKKREPMLALRLFSDRMFRNGNLVVFAIFGAMMGLLFLLPLFLQDLLGLSAFESGLTTFPQAMGMAAVAQISSRVYPRVGPRRMIIASMVMITIVSALFLLVDLNTSLWWIRGLMLLRGMAMGIGMVPMQAATYATISRADTGRASALFSTNRQVAASVGVALMATVLVDRVQSHVTTAVQGVTGQAAIQAATQHATLMGYHDAFLASALVALLGIGAAFLIRDSDAAASMRRVEPATAPAGASPNGREPSREADLVGVGERD
jgi:predicted MFS family arabinose efflux permease